MIVCVLSEVSQEDQQKIDMFMQNQHMRGRHRMPHPAMRPPGHVRPARLFGPGSARPPGMQLRPPFHARIAGRTPFGIRSPNVIRRGVMPGGGMPQRHKILVNPHFRGSSAMTLEHSQAPGPQPASAYPKLMNLDFARPRQQHPQFAVKFTNFRLHYESVRVLSGLEILLLHKSSPVIEGRA